MAYQPLWSAPQPTQPLTQPLTPAATGGYVPLWAQPPAAARRPRKQKIWEGGLFDDVLDALSLPQYAVAGLATGKGVVKGVEERTSWEEWLGQQGMEPGTKRAIVGGLMNIVLDPLWAISPAKLAKSLVTVTRTGRFVEAGIKAVETSKLGKWTGQTFLWAPGVPEDVRRAWGLMHRNVMQTADEGFQIAHEIQGKGPRVDQFVREYMAAGREGRDAVLRAFGDIPGIGREELERLARRAVAQDIKMGRALYEVGAFDRETLKLWAGRHVRRDYLAFEIPEKFLPKLEKADPELAAWVRSQVEASKEFGRLPGSVFTPKRGEVAPEVRAALGEIRGASYNIARNISLGARKVEEARFLRQVIQKYGSASFRPGYKPLIGARGPRVVEASTAIGEEAAEGVARRVQRGEGGWYLPEAIADFLNKEVRRVEPNLLTNVVSLWKLGKTVLSPAGQGRNFFGNTPLLAMSGVPWARLPDLYFKAARSILTRDETYQRAARAGNFLHDTFTEVELPKLAEAFIESGPGWIEGTRNIVRKGLGSAINFYQFNEKLGKMAAFIFATEKRAPFGVAKNLPGYGLGMADDLAAGFADHALFAYSQVPDVIRFVRRNGIVPFATFSYFAIPRFAKTLATDPARIRGVAVAADTVEGLVPEDVRLTAGRALPGWAKGFGQVLLPVGGPGKAAVLELSYIIPYGDLADMDGLKRVPGLLDVPLVNAIQDLQRNQNKFTGQPLVKPGTPREEAVRTYIDYVYKTLFPTWAPSLLPWQNRPYVTGGHGWMELEDALRERPDFFGNKKNPRSAALALAFGIRVREFDLSTEARKRSNELQQGLDDIRSRMYSVALSERLTPEDKQRWMTLLTRDMVSLLQNFANP